MSFNLGFYDLFSNLVPGILGLFVINEFFRVFNLGYIDLERLDSAAEISLIAILAYLVGHLISAISYDRWLRLFIRKDMQVAALERLKRQLPNVRIDFQPADVKLLFPIIQHHDLNLAQTIERTRSSSIMLRNISFVLILFTVLQIVRLFVHGFSVGYLLSALGLAVLARFAAQRSVIHLRWFYRDVFKEALNYGTNISEVLECSRAKTQAMAKAVPANDPQFE